MREFHLFIPENITGILLCWDMADERATCICERARWPELNWNAAAWPSRLVKSTSPARS